MFERRNWVVVASFVFLGCLNAQVTALKVGHLVNPETGTVEADQVLLIENGRFTAIGPNVAIPAGTTQVDLSKLYISPGLVDAHNHLALTYKEEPEHNSYYLTTVMDSTAIRAIQAVSNGMTILSAGFTMERTLATTAITPTPHCGWPLSRAGFLDPPSSIRELSSAASAVSFRRYRSVKA